jgi:hypothetical protein
VAEENYEPSGSEVVDQLLGDSDSIDDEAFKIEHISAVFSMKRQLVRRKSRPRLWVTCIFLRGQFLNGRFGSLKSFRARPNLASKTPGLQGALGCRRRKSPYNAAAKWLYSAMSFKKPKTQKWRAEAKT